MCGTVPGRLERFDMIAPIVFTAASVPLTHGPWRPLGVNPGEEAEDARQAASQLVSTLERAGQVHDFANGMGLAAPRAGSGRTAAVIRAPEGETVTGAGA